MLIIPQHDLPHREIREEMQSENLDIGADVEDMEQSCLGLSRGLPSLLSYSTQDGQPEGDIRCLQ